MAELVDRAQGGDRAAYGELVEMTWPRLVALARAILAGDDNAEDIVQEALVGAWTKLDSLRRPEKFPAWIRRIVSRRCYAHLRRSRTTATAALAGPQLLDHHDGLLPGACCSGWPPASGR